MENSYKDHSRAETVVAETKHPSGVAKEIPYGFPIVLPHELFSFMHKNFPDKLEMSLTGGKSEQQLPNKWDSVPSDDTAWSHKGIFHGMDMSAAAPAISHSDFVPVAEDAAKLSVLAMSTMPIFGLGNHLEKTLLYVAVPKYMTDEQCFHNVLSQQGCDEAIVKTAAKAAKNRITLTGCQHGRRRSPVVATCAYQVLLAKGYEWSMNACVEGREPT